MKVHFIVIFLVVVLILTGTESKKNKNKKKRGKRGRKNTHASADSSKLRPNIVFIYTDDQDDILGSLTAMPNLQRFVMKKGVRFTNSYVSTPLCCPSRSALITGRYGHNTGAVNNIEHCGSKKFNKKEIPKTWIRLLHSSGYRTFFAGKYIHKVPHQSVLSPLPNTTFSQRTFEDNLYTKITTIPPGWDWFNRWQQAMQYKYYYNYTFFINQTRKQYGSKSQDYLTTVVQNLALDFVRFSAVDDKPFFMLVAPTAPHDPPLYDPEFDDIFSSVKALKPPSFGKYSPDKHWLMRSLGKKLTKNKIDCLDKFYRDRWRTLISVDKMIIRLLREILKIGKLKNTIFVFSSDNGYHMGQFNLPTGKRKAYEFDLKVPLIFMGPGIAQNKVRRDLVQNIDLGPTFLELAGVKNRGGKWHDGRSIVSLLSPDESVYQAASNNWRTFLLVEYTGECNVRKKHERGQCIDAKGKFTLKCECKDAVNNTYICVRHFVRKSINEVYCEYDDVEQFREYYDLTKDPWQLNNTYNQMNEEKKLHLKTHLHSLKSCRGMSCWMH